ncbi:MAG: hypothetical protein Q8L37_04695 [Candidatus Gottesmanbacteria bacterium]|nr:hypothetical protein [Candidatus Gottesmanbacteria bacterium]
MINENWKKTSELRDARGMIRSRYDGGGSERKKPRRKRLGCKKIDLID